MQKVRARARAYEHQISDIQTSRGCIGIQRMFDFIKTVFVFLKGNRIYTFRNRQEARIRFRSISVQRKEKPKGEQESVRNGDCSLTIVFRNNGNCFSLQIFIFCFLLIISFVSIKTVCTHALFTAILKSYLTNIVNRELLIVIRLFQYNYYSQASRIFAYI